MNVFFSLLHKKPKKKVQGNKNEGKGMLHLKWLFDDSKLLFCFAVDLIRVLFHLQAYFMKMCLRSPQSKEIIRQFIM